MINKWTRNKTIIPNVLFFAGGYPKFHLCPRAIRWGNCLSIFWLDTELVIKLREK